ncbi:30S ribosomal protein THX [Oscillatoria amoena NRMC-F 0135]|nr:30S ribosomal protein THX [Oscillatoria amoena NRMC-F 0135]
MGKGDKKSKKGKRWIGSYGVSRNRKKIKARLKRSASVSLKPAGTATTTEAAKPRKTARKKASA